MSTSYSIAAGQKSFPKVIADSEKGDPIAIDRHGETVAYVISKARFDAILETMELLSNTELIETLRRDQAGLTTWTALDALDDDASPRTRRVLKKGAAKASKPARR